MFGTFGAAVYSPLKNLLEDLTRLLADTVNPSNIPRYLKCMHRQSIHLRYSPYKCLECPSVQVPLECLSAQVPSECLQIVLGALTLTVHAFKISLGICQFALYGPYVVTLSHYAYSQFIEYTLLPLVLAKRVNTTSTR